MYMKTIIKHNTIALAEGACILTFLPIVGLRMMTKPRKETQSIGSALFVLGSLLWLAVIIAGTAV